MLRKVLINLGICFTFLLFAGYFVFASLLTKRGREDVLCREIRVSILDSTVNRFISKQEVRRLILTSESNPMEKNLYDIDLCNLEHILERRSAIRKSDVSFSRDGILNVAVTQRKPIMRLHTDNGGFYVDETSYVFPLVSSFTSFVPVVTGRIPINFRKDYRGTPEGKNREWLEKLVELVNYITIHEFWEAQIEQIDVRENGDVCLYTRIGDQTICFGPIEDIDYKFAKLNAFYRDIVPLHGWEKYSGVNLKYSNQIVCTKRKNNKKK